MGLSGRVPPRVDAATKSRLLDLLEQACGQGWTVRGACQVLQVSELRVYRWLHRRAAGELADQAPGGCPMHGLLDWEVAEIMRLRTVAKDGALAALAESRPGVQQAKRDLELEAARAEAARLGVAVRELAVKLGRVEGHGRWG